MTRPLMIAAYVLTLVTMIIGVDVFLFRHRVWERLLVNIAIVVVFAAIPALFLRRA